MLEPSRETIATALLVVDDWSLPPEQRLGMRAVGRALCYLRARQLRDLLQYPEDRNHALGFMAVHTKLGLSMAKYYEEHGRLSFHQVNFWLAPNQQGVPKICEYWKQIQQESILSRKQA
jgi:hypothetical protein